MAPVKDGHYLGVLQGRENLRFAVKADTFRVRELASLWKNLNRNMSACGDLNSFEDDSLTASAYFSEKGIAVNLYQWLVNNSFAVSSGQPVSRLLVAAFGPNTFLMLPDVFTDFVDKLWAVSAEVLETAFGALPLQAQPFAE